MPGLEGLDKWNALRFAASVHRSRARWRKYQVEEMLRKIGGEKDPIGVGRVIALLATWVSEG